MKTNFTVVGLTRLGMKLEFTASEADALTTVPSELFKFHNNHGAMVSYDYSPKNLKQHL